MSYEPVLLISKKDLDKHKDLILDGDWQYPGTHNNKKDEKTRGGEDGQTVMEYIQDVYKNHKPVRVCGVELILCTPHHSSYNKLIREKLYALRIEYGESI